MAEDGGGAHPTDAGAEGPKGARTPKEESRRAVTRRDALLGLCGCTAAVAAATAAAISTDVDVAPRREGELVHRGRKAVVRFKADRCIHVRACVLRRPSAFKPDTPLDRWIDPDAADPEALSLVEAECASGAITVDRLDGGPAESAPEINLATLRENGPYAFAAPLAVAGMPDGFRATLCRCGGSSRKPHCDGSHRKIGFLASGDPEPRKDGPLVDQTGPVSVTPKKNGPLLAEGKPPLQTVADR